MSDQSASPGLLAPSDAMGRSKIVPFPQPMPDNEVRTIARQLALTVSYARQEDRKGPMIMTNSAHAFYGDCYQELTQEYVGVLGAVTARAAAQVQRLALTLAVVAGVFELCLVGVMVIYELLGHGRVITDTEVTSPDVRLNVGMLAVESVRGPTLARPALERPRRPKAAKREPLAGSVTSFVHDRIYPADGERLEMKSLTAEYRTWCGQIGCAPIGLSELLDEIEKICSKLGIEIEVGDDQRVYCVGVRLGNQVQQLPAAVH